MNEEGRGQAEVEKGNMPAMTAVAAARMMLRNGTDDQSSMQPRGRGDQGLSSRRPAWPWEPVSGVFRGWRGHASLEAACTSDEGGRQGFGVGRKWSEGNNSEDDER